MSYQKRILAKQYLALFDVLYVSCRILLHMSFLSPVIVLVLWVKPIARDFLANAPMGKTSVTM